VAEKVSLIKEVLCFGDVLINFYTLPRASIVVIPFPPCARMSLMDAPLSKYITKEPAFPIGKNAQRLTALLLACKYLAITSTRSTPVYGVRL